MNGYQGHRILEAMRSAPRYADAVFRQICSVAPPAGSLLLDFGAGDGVFFEKFVVEGYRVDCVEPDIALQRSLSTLGGRSTLISFRSPQAVMILCTRLM